MKICSRRKFSNPHPVEGFLEVSVNESGQDGLNKNLSMMKFRNISKVDVLVKVYRLFRVAKKD